MPPAKLRRGGTGQAPRGDPNHAGAEKLCFICGKPGHLSKDCPNRSNKRGLGAGARQEYAPGFTTTFTGGCLRQCCQEKSARVLGTQQYEDAFAYDDQLLKETETYCPDYHSDPEIDPIVLASSDPVTKHDWGGPGFGILDGGATSTCASYEIVELIADTWEPLDQHSTLEITRPTIYTFAGGEKSTSKTRVWVPNEVFEEGIAINVVPCTDTPLLIGTDMLRYYGLVLDYAHNTVYSHRLKQNIPCVVLKSGHLAIKMLPDNKE